VKFLRAADSIAAKSVDLGDGTSNREFYARALRDIALRAVLAGFPFNLKYPYSSTGMPSSQRFLTEQQQGGIYDPPAAGFR